MTNIRIINIRKTVLTLSAAFKKAWCMVKQTMTVRAAGVSFSNIQERLAFLRQFQDVTVSLVRGPENQHDHNAIKRVAHIREIRKQTMIGYVPRVLSEILAAILDAGIPVSTEFMGVIVGCWGKETLGALLNISV